MDRIEVGEIKGAFSDEIERWKKRAATPGASPLPEVPAGRYTDPEFYALEQKHLWPRSWLFAGHVGELPAKGSYKLWRDAGAPILLVRGKDNVIRGFYNTCAHRGGPLVHEERGQTDTLRCKFHCWTYSDDGALQYVPDEHEFPGLDKSSKRLLAVKVELWGNWIFVNCDPEAESLNAYLGSVVSDLEAFRPEELTAFHNYSVDLKCNWKVALDAFLEVYHVKYIHPETADNSIDYRGFSPRMYKNGHSVHFEPRRKGVGSETVRLGLTQEEALARDLESAKGDPALEIARIGACTWNVFPNFLFVGSTGMILTWVIWPTAINRSRIDAWWWVRDSDKDAESEDMRNRAIASMDQLLKEDLTNLAWIQDSMESPAFKSIPLGQQERLIYNHEQAVDRKIGLERLPASLAIPQII